MSEIAKRRANRSQDEIVTDIDDRIAKHESQILEAEEKCKKTVAYHRVVIERLTAKREAALAPKKRTPPAAELLKKIKESGKSIDEIIAMIDEWKI